MQPSNPLLYSLPGFRYCELLLAPAELAAAEDAQTEIENAVAGLRAAGTADHIPRGLLTRAWLRFVTGDEDGARGPAQGPAPTKTFISVIRCGLPAVDRRNSWLADAFLPTG